MDRFVDELRKYQNECPLDPKSFFNWQQSLTERKSESYTPNEEAALALLLNLTFESGSHLEEHFSLFLQNAFVLFPENESKIGKTMMRYIGLTINADAQRYSINF